MAAQGSTGLSSLDFTSFIILPLALCLFTYMAFIRTADNTKKVFTALAQETEGERNRLAAAKIKEIKTSRLKDKKQTAGDSASAPGKIADVPMFLKKINYLKNLLKKNFQKKKNQNQNLLKKLN